jgi:hypothetical protein
VLNLSIDHITNKPRTATVRHRNAELLRESSQKVGEEWVNEKTPITTPFAFDIGAAQHGWEEYVKVKGRVTTLTPVSEAKPERPSDTATGIAVIPILLEGGIKCDFVIDIEPVAKGVKALWPILQLAPEAANGQIPVIQYMVGGDQDGEPRFEVEGWIERKPVFGSRLIPPPSKTEDQVPNEPQISSKNATLLARLQEKQKARDAA